MLKSSSLCLYSSNLGTFWLKIEQSWPFEEISIFSNGGHLGYRTALTDTILKGDHLRIKTLQNYDVAQKLNCLKEKNQTKTRKKSMPLALDNYGQSCFVRSDFFLK
jgi:hypothetical protein